MKIKLGDRVRIKFPYLDGTLGEIIGVFLNPITKKLLYFIKVEGKKPFKFYFRSKDFEVIK